MNRVIYFDDRQVVAIQAVKMWDDNAESVGSTTVHVMPYEPIVPVLVNED